MAVALVSRPFSEDCPWFIFIDYVNTISGDGFEDARVLYIVSSGDGFYECSILMTARASPLQPTPAHRLYPIHDNILVGAVGKSTVGNILLPTFSVWAQNIPGWPHGNYSREGLLDVISFLDFNENEANSLPVPPQEMD